MFDSIIDYVVGGQHFVGMSESWKQMCLGIPDSPRVRFPGYQTGWLDTQINGQDVVLQVWKGNCLDPVPGLPGGVGGEVGIYQRVPGRQMPSVLEIPIPAEIPTVLHPIVRHVVSAMIEDAVKALDSGIPIWWPYPQLGAQIDMTLLDPKSGAAFLVATPPEPANGYWMSRWMRYDSYLPYAVAQGANLPAPTDYVMQFQIGNRKFRWDGITGIVAQ